MTKRLRISERALKVPASPIRSLGPLAAETKKRGIHVHHVNIGQPDLSAPPEILEAIRPPADGVIPYAPSSGQPETIAAWCAYYAQLGVELEARDVIVTTGGGEAIGFAMLSVADPGDEILIFDPTYASYLGYAASSNITLKALPVSPPDYRLPPASEIRGHIGPRTKAIVLVNPSNPTGTVYTREELRSIMELALEHGLFVISDETYRELTFDGRQHVNAFEFLEMDEHVIVVDSISKRFSATGLRVGCVASRNREVMAAVLRLAMARLSSPTVEQLACIPLLQNPAPYTTWLRGEYERRRDATFKAMAAIPGVRLAKPEGAFYLMAGLPVPDSALFARWLLTDFQRDRETVMVAPGAGFYVTPGLGAHEVRLAYVLNVKSLERAVGLLGEALAEYQETVAA